MLKGISGAHFLLTTEVKSTFRSCWSQGWKLVTFFLCQKVSLQTQVPVFTISYHFPLTDHEKKWLPQVIMCTGRNYHCFLNITNNTFKWFTVPCNWFSENTNILLTLWQLSTASIIVTFCRTWLMSFIFSWSRSKKVRSFKIIFFLRICKKIIKLHLINVWKLFWRA